VIGWNRGWNVLERMVGITGQSLPALTLDPGDVSAVRRWSFVSSPSPEVKAKATAHTD
jgi:hypothetical protein